MAFKFAGNILLDIISASNLPPIDNGAADPYCKVTPEEGLHIAADIEKFKTNTVQRNVNPQWGKSFEVPIAEPAEGKLRFRVMDHNTWTKNKFLGEASINVESIVSGSFKAQSELRLVDEAGASAGTLLVKAVWVPVESTDKAPLEEIAMYERGSYQFKTFISSAAKRVEQDVAAVNRQARDWLNEVRHLIELIKLDNETITEGAAVYDRQTRTMNSNGTAYITVWYRVKEA